MDKIGVGYAGLKELNPRIIYAMISGFGRMPGLESEYAQRPAFDIVAEAMSGVMDLIGFEDRPPTFTLYGLADVYSGMVGAYGIMQALFMRERTGEGQLVDVSLLDNMLALNERMVALYSVVAETLPSEGSWSTSGPEGPSNAPTGTWPSMSRTTGSGPGWPPRWGGPIWWRTPGAPPGRARAANADFLQPILEGWMADKTRAEVVDAFNAAGMPTGPVYTAEDVFADDHFRVRGMLAGDR